MSWPISMHQRFDEDMAGYFFNIADLAIAKSDLSLADQTTALVAIDTEIQRWLKRGDKPHAFTPTAGLTYAPCVWCNLTPSAPQHQAFENGESES